MPYNKEELKVNDFYQEITRRDEAKYIEVIQKRTTTGNLTDGILRDSTSGNIILFEKITPGQGTDGSGHPENNKITWSHGYFDYDENEDLNKIIDREFTEL
ncbi:hypothetical protein HOE22_05245 [Candidatus Woesearchaeota archaeon]|jgi:hypothetical protein|nr:hypothetical protein [Candidatus Woesearchaeota archaeon]MBT4731143.1 hypothetical protein [Candidatus Woesearchaeota archaeon]MBT5759046.1 hypothetical protein [Candidatus Neomarinimicrobiota bacterium]MBT7557378.1 hypothetical protein [Candidatus Woesearchaeota archaeon]